MNFKSIFRMLVVLLSLGWFYLANAVVIPCEDVTAPTTLSKVQYATACEKSTTATQDFLETDPMTVNAEGFFGNTDWVYLDQKDDPAGNGQTGTWSFVSNYWLTYANVMLIFKDGAGTTLLGFLLQSGKTSGNWDSPFTADSEFPNLCVHHDATRNKPAYDDCSKVKDVSHISYYARGKAPDTGGEDPPPTDVTEPSPLLLMMMGFMGLFFVRRFRTA